MIPCAVFRKLGAEAWWDRLGRLEEALVGPDGDVERAYLGLLAELAHGGHESLAAAAAAVLCDGEELLALATGPLPAGLRSAALHDLERLGVLLARDWRGESEAAVGRSLPPLVELAPAGEFASFAGMLCVTPPAVLLDHLLARYRTHGTGVLARHLAFRWQEGRLVGVRHPARDRMEELVGLERQLERLTANVERFLDGTSALHTLLYGPRGSGKSTSVRSLLDRFAGRGLRLVEVPADHLGGLLELGELLRLAPHRYLLFIDDLSFEAGDDGYRPLKTLLEGSLVERPGNMLLIATSNRRHLVRERLSDRPLPEDDDVHGWDTMNERLALADRFGLTITFPSAGQREYLLMVRQLVRQRGLEVDDLELEERAVRFAEWGNGYSGRTARQFVDALS